ncbi:DUF2834 domain-containing protein [Aquimarina sp. U1-2]|uniref:DUF2834 domain-containing protein n=1 Tax=Aquimarina sp. U1-2 TaxID=2823141 RepID=UPI001AEC926C|nr:DUF2834 domain-containing protein [Aquimarina sp. U1-2]MBP2834127.1 DUF2834 domain-containing protein [Aquimarina sp. U1-2]
MKLKYIFLLLAVIGVCYTWYFNIQFYLTAEDTSLLNFIAQTKTTFPARSLSADLMIVVITFFAWYIPEAIQLKIKHWWVFIPLTFLVAIAFAFPLFLYVRQIKLDALQLRQKPSA